MNKLDFNGGAYRCEVVEGAIFEGNVGNLVAHFATDTITLHDRATRSAVSILSSRTENLQINGSVVSFEQAQTIIENALKQGGGGGASSADAVSYDNTTSGLTATNVQSALDEVGANLGGFVIDNSKDIQSQFTTENARYIISSEIDLNGGTLTIPSNCVLIFRGGKISNGTIEGSFIVESNYCCFKQLHFVNTSIPFVKSIWFEIYQNVDCTEVLNDILAINSKSIVFSKYDFDMIVSAPSSVDDLSQRSAILVKEGGKVVDFGDNTISLTANSYDNYNIIEVRCNDITISNAHIIGDVEYHTGTSGEQGHGIRLKRASGVVLNNIIVEKCWGDGIDLIDATDFQLENVNIVSCKCLSNRRQGISIEAGKNVLLYNCEFANTGSIKATSPSAGVVVEPWHDGDYCKISNVVIDSCYIHDNSGQIEVNLIPNYNITTPTTNNITIKNCIIEPSANKIALYASDVRTINFIGNKIGNKAFNGAVVFSGKIGLNISENKINGMLYVHNGDNAIIEDNEIVYSNAVSNIEYIGTYSCALAIKEYFGVSAKSNKIVNNIDGRSVSVFEECGSNLIITDTLFKNNGSQGTNVNTIKLTSRAQFVNCDFIGFKTFRVENTADGNAKLSFTNCKVVMGDFSSSTSALIQLYCKRYSDNDYDVELINCDLTDVLCVFVRNVTPNPRLFLSRLNRGVRLCINTNVSDIVVDRRDFGITTDRPTLNQYQIGIKYYDTTISKEITWNGTSWVDANGTAV